MKILSMKMPEKVEVLERSNNYGKFLFSPLEPGWGITIGNAMRRSLLSSIQGFAITEAKIGNILHEFTAIDGVYEDVPEIIHNLKQVKIKLLNSIKKKFLLPVKDKGEIKAGDIQVDTTAIVINPSQHILTVTDDIKPFNIELTVTAGRGYVPSEWLKEDEAPIGTIFIDAFYSPVVKANFTVDETRVGARLNYEKLILEVWTDGVITPNDAISLAAENLITHFNLFTTLKEEVTEKVSELKKEEYNLKQLLKMNITDLELSVRAQNCLKNNNIHTLFDLVQLTEKELLLFPNFGRKSLNEVAELLKKYNLQFGMDVSHLKENET